MMLENSISMLRGSSKILRFEIDPPLAKNQEVTFEILPKGNNVAFDTKINYTDKGFAAIRLHAKNAGEVTVVANIKKYGNNGHQAIPYNTFMDKCKVTVEPPGREMLNKVIANHDSYWYRAPFNTVDYPQCPWHVLGRVAEFHGVRIKLPEGGGSGGWWIKNFQFAEIIKFDGKGSWIKDANGNDTLTDAELEARKAKNVKIEYNPALIKPKSVACFLCAFDTYEGHPGHVVFIEDVEVNAEGEKWVYFSESNNGDPQGSVRRKKYEDFISMYDNYTKYNNENVFQGYIQFN